MISLHCINSVKAELFNIGIHFFCIESGSIEFQKELTDEQTCQFKKVLFNLNFQILDPHDAYLIEDVIQRILTMPYDKNHEQIMDYLHKIAKRLDSSYNYLSSLFSEIKGIDIQQFVTLQKIESVKELVLYEGFTIAHISKLLHYKNRTQLVKLFKKSTGLTPSYYKQLRKQRIEKSNQTQIFLE